MVRKFLSALLLASVLAGAGLFELGGHIAAPQQRAIAAPITSLALEPVALSSENGRSVAGWFVQGRIGMPGVLLLHSVRSSRLEMLGRAGFLNRAGYSVLLIDMQAHGETPGEQITFGYRESSDAHSAISYLRRRLPGRKVGVIGVSLGGAAALLGEAPIDADALVLEGVYSSISNAIENRLALRLGDLEDR